MRLLQERPASEDACYTMPFANVRLADLYHVATTLRNDLRGVTKRRSNYQPQRHKATEKHRGSLGVFVNLCVSVPLW